MRGGVVVPCYPDQSNDWALSAAEMERSYREATDSGIDVRLFVCVNPCNPTGRVKTRRELIDIVRFCEDKGIALLADEVYQENTYDDRQPFISFRKVIEDLRSHVQLISLNSVSKGFLGECGHRGGYTEFHNIDERIVRQAHKMATIDQCGGTTGQLLLDLYCRPPQSKECKSIWDAEVKAVIDGLKWKSDRLVNALNGLPGITSSRATGAMYVFPSLDLPKKAIDAASKLIIDGEPAEPDMFWAWTLLHEIGIVVVPGAGFWAKTGSCHFRITFLPPPEKMERLICRLTTFQTHFMAKYQ
jgi:alanine transaminase